MIDPVAINITKNFVPVKECACGEFSIKRWQTIPSGARQRVKCEKG